jgi:hypothetical protein
VLWYDTSISVDLAVSIIRVKWHFNRQAFNIFLLAHTYFYPFYSLFLYLGSLLSTMHFTLKMAVAWSSKTMVLYCTSSLPFITNKGSRLKETCIFKMLVPE